MNSRTVAYMVWMIASIFYAYQYILRVMPSIMLTDIMDQFEIGATLFGQFSGIYYIGYSLLHLPIGIMLDRYGPKKIMSLCILLTVIGMLPLVFAHHWIYPLMGRLLVGIGSSAAILGLFKIIRLAFNESQFPRMLSFSVTIGLVGAIYGGAPVSYMVATLGYQAVVEIFALIGVGLALITYWVIPEEKAVVESTVSSDIWEVLSNKRVILSCLFAGMMVGPLEGFADVWGTAFLKHTYELDETVASSLPSMIFIGMCFGAPLLSFLAEKIGYLGAIAGAGTLMVAIFASLLIAHLTTSLISMSFILVGICCAYQILAIYKASTYVREQVAGLATAVANMVIMIFGYIFHSTIGAIVNAAGGPASTEALTYGIAVIPIALAIGTVGFICLYVQERNSAPVAA